jgi:putative transposase
MREWESQSHVRWYCRYHIVIVPKYRRKAIFGALRRELGPILQELCKRYAVELIEGHVMPDHVHMLLSIPPKFSVANIVGKLKGKSTILINQKYVKQRNFRGLHFWSRGYCVSTTGYDEQVIRNYIRNQEDTDKKEDQLLFDFN